MEYFPAALEKLVEQFARLPGIGSKSAQRLAFFVLSLPEEEAKGLLPMPSSTPSAPSRSARLPQSDGRRPLPYLLVAET